MDDGVGVGRDMEEEEPDGEVLDGVALSVETPLKELRELCDRQGLPRSGGKNKILKRLKQHYEQASWRTSSLWRKAGHLMYHERLAYPVPASRSYTT